MSEGTHLSEIMECALGLSEGFNNPNHIMYDANKSAKVGTSVRCAECGKIFNKVQYSQAFCPPILVRGKKRYVCKDMFHNAQPHRQERTLLFMS